MTAALSALGGLLIIAVVLADAFEALVLPRRVMRPFRLTRLYYRLSWSAWVAAGDLLPRRRRETWLSVFGPLSLLSLFALWAGGLILGYALLQVAASEFDFGDALYLSGETFTTLGFGDLTPRGPFGRALAVVEAASGFGYFAVVIGYLPVLYQAFSRREALISLLDARAGSPPSAGRLLLRLAPSSPVLGRFLERAEEWSAELLESQLSYPVLGYYRSQHDNQSWVAALLCILDASALLLTVAPDVHRDQARLTFAMARHALIDLALVLRRPPACTNDRLPPDRLRELIEALQVTPDDAAAARLAELRTLYEPVAEALGAYFHYPLPDVWPADERPDNWRTAAGMRPADPLTSLGGDHFGGSGSPASGDALR